MPARILVIEDNQANLELMSYLLRAFGYQPETALDGPEGLAAAFREAPDLVICDVQLPSMEGYEVARRMKSSPELRDVPIVAVTALAMVGDRDRVLAAGFDGYISKPIEPDAFVHQIESFMKQSQRSIGRESRREGAAAVSSPTGEAIPACTILVVDNTAVNVVLARSILEPHGFRVIAAAGSQEGIAAARNQAFDLILSDVCMVGESGYDFIQAVKADPRLAAIPFVFITSTMATESDRARGLALGAVRYLFRPIEPAELLAELRACLKEGTRHGGHTDSR